MVRSSLSQLVFNKFLWLYTSVTFSLPSTQKKASRYRHDDNNVVQRHPPYIHEVHGQDLVSNFEAPTVVDGGLQCYPGDEDAIGPGTSVAFSDVQAQSLTRPLYYFH